MIKILLITALLLSSLDPCEASLKRLIDYCRTFPFIQVTERDLADDVVDIAELEISLDSLQRIEIEGVIGGAENKGLYEGEWQGHQIFVKVIQTGQTFLPHMNFTLRSFIKEIVFYQTLSQLGITPHFYGMIRLENNQYGIVTENIQNAIFVKQYNENPTTAAGRAFNAQYRLVRNQERSLRESWAQDIEHHMNLLTEKGIGAHDAQFLLAPNGRAYMIDFSLFYMINTNRGHHSNQEIAESFIKGILGH